jgi:hypothetical protein
MTIHLTFAWWFWPGAAGFALGFGSCVFVGLWLFGTAWAPRNI